LVEFFGEPLFNARITVAYEAEDAPYQQKNISRREMFSQVTDTSKAGTKQLLRMLPGMEDEDRGRSLDYRIMLNHRVKQIKAATETPVRYGWYMPAINDKCYGCGKCEKACRAGALKVETDAQGISRIVLTPWKCSECGYCASACCAHAVDGMKLRQLTTLGPVSLHKFTIIKCTECGKPVQPSDKDDGLCSVCRIRAKSRKRQEEAAERTRQRNAEREAKKQAEAAAKAAKEAQATAAEAPVSAVSDATSANVDNLAKNDN
jgi:NAD-dependent dihydropyrimidine dehydrogenase PreA subunit